eukprot:gene17084-biopygen14382
MPKASVGKERRSRRNTTMASTMASATTARNEPSEPSSSAATTESTSQLSEDNVQQIRAIVEESMEASLSRVAREAAQAAVELTLANRSTPPTAPENTIITQPSIDEFERLGRASIPINGNQHRSQAIDGGFTPEIPNAYVRRIQGGEFFEISKLLPENLYQLDNSSPDYNNVSLSMGPNSELRLTKRSSVKRIENISEWTSAFLAYVKLVVDKFPARARELLEYIDIIRALTWLRLT